LSTHLPPALARALRSAETESSKTISFLLQGPDTRGDYHSRPCLVQGHWRSSVASNTTSKSVMRMRGGGDSSSASSQVALGSPTPQWTNR